MRKPPLPRLVLCLSATLGWFAAGCDSGSSGNHGAAGTTGAAGVNGAAGATAAAGTTGSAGVTGTAGTTGSAGATGAAGATGSAGATATAGTTGGAGAIGTAGATGTAGAAGGSTGTAGTTGTGGTAGGVVRSLGCGKPAAQALAMFVNYKETITASALVTAKWQPRDYWVWLPTNYDPSHAYPTVFVGPGCGGKGNSTIPIQTATGNDAIIIGLDYNSAATGRDCFMTEAFPDPEVNYVEETAANVEAAFCVDKSRLFIEGFSSGSWISYLLGCVDGGPAGGLFKATGNASGELQGVPANACKGPVPWMAVHNNPDGNNNYPGARDHMIKINGCTMPPVTTPYDAGPMVKAPAGGTISCVQYMGCTQPTVFCTTTGYGHNDGSNTGASTYGFWKFWMGLP